jgi:rare lipoprotein A (peptidoglycan hydrolase)
MKKYLLTIFVFVNNYINQFDFSKIIESDDDSVKIDEQFNQSESKSTIEENTPQDSLVKKGGTHHATWYNPHGARTASGIKFHRDSLTCAYNFSKFGSLLKVTNISSGSSVVVKVTDRMGNKSKNHIDLSRCAFDSIGNPRSGVMKVMVEEIIR